MQVKRTIEGYITQTTNITNTFVFVDLLIVFPIVLKALIHGFDHYI